jgi:uracil-DNA glycosylase family 4
VADRRGGFSPPDQNCRRCPRLAAFRDENRLRFPDFHNRPVDSFGPESAGLLVVGLAPGLRGANCTGRPFTGDAAGDLLYEILAEHGFSEGKYQARADDGLRLIDCRITNAVRCLPPQNKPVGAEIRECRDYLVSEIESMKNMTAILALGRIAHEAVVVAKQGKRSDYPFGHAARHRFPDGMTVFDSYHCSRYNTNTGRLTREMFTAVFGDIRDYLASSSSTAATI